MTATRTLNIVADIRTALKDREYKLIDSDEQIFPVLTDIQSLLATNYIIIPQQYEVDLINGQDEYNIDKFIMKIVDIRRGLKTDPRLKIEIGGTTGDNERILYVNNPMDIITGQVLVLHCFMRVAISSGDIIDENHDPILDEQYDKYLTELFLSDYRSDKNTFRKKDEIYKELFDYVSEQIAINFGLLSESRSVKLCYEIRNALNDFRYKIIDNDMLIYNGITEWVEYISSQFLIQKVNYELDLIPNQSEYPIDNFVMKLLGIYQPNADDEDIETTDPNLEIEVLDVSDDDERKIIVHNPEDIINGQVLTFRALIRPVLSEDDIVDRYKEPLINKRFDRYIKDLFLSKYRKINEEFKTQEKIEEDLKSYIAKTLSLDKVTPMGDPYGTMQF